MRLRKGTVDGYEWRCRNQSKDNHHDVVRVSPPHALLILSHILINFQVIHHKRIHALAKPISRQTQDNSYSKFAFAKPSALSHTPNDVVGLPFDWLRQRHS
ncbi:hypothetical protein TNCV_755821 [Trichonephila clavipes]|nr:hypothetical protein TNCV_755821 [Trichonephila clavipes]